MLCEAPDYVKFTPSLLYFGACGVPRERRGARFTSAVTAARAGEVLFQAQESVEVAIAEEMRGGNGFGYDPLFFYPPFGKTFGQVAREEKDRVSHRGKAFACLRAFLASPPRDDE